MEDLRICAVVGARPNFIKMAPLLEEMRSRPGIAATLIHTGQHFSPEMSDSFFRELGMPQPDINLGVGAGTQTEQTAEIMRRIERVFCDAPCHLVLVVGDVNSTMAAALVAAKLGIPIAHVEAGLRSFDRTMPEEINRIVTDALSDFLFVTEPSGRNNLLAEGVPERKIFFTGNVMIDTLLRFRGKASCSPVLERLGLSSGSYAVVTLHRPSNVDNPAHLKPLLECLRAIAADLPVVFPVHPRTRARIASEGLSSGEILCVPPLGYLDFLRLLSEARLVLTDSGGIQEETTILRVPCLTLRENTERPVTIEQGSNRLVGTQPAAILQVARAILAEPAATQPPRVPEFWDGKASMRIVDILESSLRPDSSRSISSPASQAVPGKSQQFV
jgi:UDP-N-acetylglucosamine 2-epimerase (non-hydrolysing)